MGGAAAPFCLSEKTNRKIGFRSQLVKHVSKPGSSGLTLGRIFEEIVAHLVASRFFLANTCFTIPEYQFTHLS